jgi:predicted Zn-dependent protease
MNQTTSKLAVATLTFVLLLQTALAAPAKRKPQAKPATPAKPETIYDRAKKDLPEHVYVIYRIVERIARANNLDRTPWRIVAIQEYNVNAFARDINLIALYTGLMDQLAGDASGIACVVGHEMAHHVNRHIAMGESETAALIEQYRQEAEIAVKKEAESAQSEATGAAVGGALLQGIGNIFGGWGSVAGNATGSALGATAQQRLEEGQKRIEQIVAKKRQELEQKVAENNRKQEFEADKFGYQYITRAGFNPEGCLRMMEVLGRTPGAEFDTTHPAAPKRLEQLKTLMVEYPPQKLAQEGQLRLNTSRPLTYSLSEDGKSLRVNSQQGGSTADTIDRMFNR